MYSHPVGARIWPTSVRTRPSRASHVAWSPVRRVPRSTPCCGIAFAASPACTAPQTRTVPDRGSTWRVSRSGSCVISSPSASTRSAVRCGRAVWPPGEASSISTTSQAEVIGPVRVPSLPTSSRGSQCRAKIRSTPSTAPSATMSIAPPGCTSSAGWKISRTRPGSAGALASARPAPSTIAVWASCPQACMTFGTVEANGSPVASCSGRASMSARSATQRRPWPTSQTRPVPSGSVRGSRPAAVSRPADQRRGAALGPAQLRRGVQRPTPGDDLGPVQRQPGVQPRRTAARAHVDNRGAGGRHSGRVLLQDRHRTPPPLDSPWCISPYSSPGRRCTKRI